MTRWPWFTLLALAACPPSLDGAPCNSDNDCPSSQRCVAPSDAGRFGQCQDGTRGKTDYMLDAGFDAGIDAGPVCPDSPLAGTLTLNGGSPLPQNNLAWVDIWDHAPALIGPDGGRPYELPDIQVQVTQGSGAFSVSEVMVGKPYWVSGQFDITFSLDGGDLFDSAVSPPTLLVPGFPPACNLPLDVSTLHRCEVMTVFNQGISANAYLLAAVADVRDITTNQELTGETSVQGQIPDSGSAGSLPLVLEDDPTVLDGGVDGGVVFGGLDYTNGPPVYAITGNLPLSLANLNNRVYNASPGPYGLSIVGTGYRAGACTVDVTPQSSEPQLDTGTPLAWTDAGLAITWQSAADVVDLPGAQVTYYDFILVGLTDQNTLTTTWVSPFFPRNSNYHSEYITPGACPSGKACTMVLFSGRDVLTSLGANPLIESLEYSGAIVPALPTAP